MCMYDDICFFRCMSMMTYVSLGSLMCMYDDICFFRFIVCVCMMTYVSLGSLYVYV